MCSGSEAGSYLRLIDSRITQLKAQGPSRTCNESKEEEEAGAWVQGGRERFGLKGSGVRGNWLRVQGVGLRVEGSGVQLLPRNVQRFRGGLVSKAHRLCVSLNSKLESNKEEEERSQQSYGGLITSKA